MPTRYLSAVPRELWPSQAATVEEFFRDNGLLTPAWFGIPPKKAYTPRELAPYFATSEETIIRMIRDRIIGAVKVGHSWKISWFAVCLYLMNQQGINN